MRILTFVSFYLPGYKGDGPIRTLANMVDRLGDEFEFKIVTTNRDFDDTKPYPGIRIDGWNRVGKAEVFYMAPKRRFLRDFRRLLSSTEYDILYLNSFFSQQIILIRLRDKRPNEISTRFYKGKYFKRLTFNIHDTNFMNLLERKKLTGKKD